MKVMLMLHHKVINQLYQITTLSKPLYLYVQHTWSDMIIYMGLCLCPPESSPLSPLSPFISTLFSTVP